MKLVNFAIVLGIAPALATVSCSRKPKELNAQVSYTIGAQFGRSLKSQGLTLDTKYLAAGIVDGYKGEKAQLNEEEMQQAMSKMSEARQAEMRVESERNKVKADEFMKTNLEAEGVKSTASGLQYKVNLEGQGASPKDTEVVVVNYTGKLVDGKEFDSSAKRGVPAEFPLNGVIPGWAEGLKLMKKGGKATIFVPPSLGYGERSRREIPGNSVLIFDVELVDIKPAPAPRPSRAKK